MKKNHKCEPEAAILVRSVTARSSRVGECISPANLRSKFRDLVAAKLKRKRANEDFLDVHKDGLLVSRSFQTTARGGFGVGGQVMIQAKLYNTSVALVAFWKGASIAHEHHPDSLAIRELYNEACFYFKYSAVLQPSVPVLFGVAAVPAQLRSKVASEVALVLELLLPLASLFQRSQSREPANFVSHGNQYGTRKFVRGLLAAFGAAHGRGIVHGDVKVDNTLLRHHRDDAAFTKHQSRKGMVLAESKGIYCF